MHDYSIREYQLNLYALLESFDYHPCMHAMGIYSWTSYCYNNELLACMQTSQETITQKATITPEDIGNELKSIDLPSNWVQITEEPSVLNLCQLVIKNEVAEVRITLQIYEDLTWKCTYFGKEVNPSCPVLTYVPLHVTSSAKVVTL